MRFRHLAAEAKAECVAEAVALAWAWYLRLVRQGKDVRRVPSALATFAARQVRGGRRCDRFGYRVLLCLD